MKIINEINGNEAELTEAEIHFIMEDLARNIIECQKVNDSKRLCLQASINNMTKIFKKFKRLLVEPEPVETFEIRDLTTEEFDELHAVTDFWHEEGQTPYNQSDFDNSVTLRKLSEKVSGYYYEVWEDYDSPSTIKGFTRKEIELTLSMLEHDNFFDTPYVSDSTIAKVNKALISTTYNA